MSTIENEDLAVLIEMLEAEHAKALGARNVLITLFAVCAAAIFGAIGWLAFALVSEDPDDLTRNAIAILSVLGTGGSMLVATGGFYYSSHHCLRSIERALFCARRARPKLVVNFVRQIECAAKKDRAVWVDIAMSIAT